MAKYTDEVLAMTDAALADGMADVPEHHLSEWERDMIPKLVAWWVNTGRFTWRQRQLMRVSMTRKQRREEGAAAIEDTHKENHEAAIATRMKDLLDD